MIWLKNDEILSFAVNQEKIVGNILKKLLKSNSISEETRRSLKPVGTRLGISMEFFKVYIDFIGNWPHFWTILLAINTPTYKLAKCLVPILKPLTINEYAVKHSMLNKILNSLMGNQDVDFLFTNIPLEKAIDIFANTFLKILEK